MKVLFAVSNEEISESIVKKYQKEYKQIISYKNVYYFNAILKELQKDKTYDRIVISEDLETFTNTQYDQIDKFIFEKLDAISDEASNIRGNDIPIILICSDRRTKSEQILVKLFGIGVYNAIIGNDRSVDEVCRLINRPRLKKDAKTYYKIDTEEVNYKPENENDVSEMEIQNIIAHYKRLGKNEDRYVESFNNIVAQYNDTQLRIISKFLPLNVRAVLEEKSPKYQQIMAFNSKVSDQLRYNKKEKKQGPSEMLLKTASKNNVMSNPVVIPSAVNMQGTKKLSKKKTQESQNLNQTQNKQAETTAFGPAYGQKVIHNQQTSNLQSEKNQKVNKNSQTDLLKSGYGQNVKQNQQAKTSQNKQINEDTMQRSLMQPQPISIKNKVEENMNTATEPVKRGRGRPRKIVSEEDLKEQKPKRGRGRPRKNPISSEEEKDKSLLDIEDLNEKENLTTLQESNYIDDNKEETILPGFNDIEDEEETTVLPGFNDEEDEEETVLPGFNDEEDEEETVLPGFNDEEDEEETVLPGFNDVEDEEETVLPGFNDVEDEEETVLPGFNDEEDEEETVLPGFNNVENENQQNSQDESILPGFDDEDEETQYTYVPNQTEQIEQQSTYQSNQYNQTLQASTKNNDYQQTIDLSQYLDSNKKIVSFVGTSKNGTSFIVNNLAELMSSMGVNTAILDTTKNRNSYYIYTKNDENLRMTASKSIDGLVQGVTQGIEVNKNLTVYTSLPEENESLNEVDKVLETLIKNYSLVLIDTDFDSPKGYFKQSQEIYLVQSLDILTIQPLTAFLRELKAKNLIEEKKLKIILNKTVKIRGVTDKTIIGGMAYYNDPAMSFMTELFDRNSIKYVSIPFEEETYIKYLEGIINCNISLKGYSKAFMQTLKELANMVYPVTTSKNNTYRPPAMGGTNKNPNYFSSSMNNTLDQMKRNY